MGTRGSGFEARSFWVLHSAHYGDYKKMSFLIPCPNCGERDVHEFRHGGEISPLSLRKSMDASNRDLTRYFYFAKNVAGEQKEWWYHSFGCRKWFVGHRDTVTNRVLSTEWPEKKKR